MYVCDYLKSYKTLLEDMRERERGCGDGRAGM